VKIIDYFGRFGVYFVGFVPFSITLICVSVCLVSCGRLEKVVSDSDTSEVTIPEYQLSGDSYASLVGKSLDVIEDHHIPFGEVWEKTRQRVSREGEIEVKGKKRLWIEVLTKDKLKFTILSESGESTKKWNDGKVNNEPNPVSPFLRKPIILERDTEGKWNAGLASGEESKELQALYEIIKIFDKRDLENKSLFGDKPRRVGEEWSIADEYFSDYTSAGSGRIRLVEIQNFEGYECAVLEGSWRVSGEGNGIVSNSSSAKFRIIRSLDHFVNLWVEINGTNQVGKRGGYFGMKADYTTKQLEKIVSGE